MGIAVFGHVTWTIWTNFRSHGGYKWNLASIGLTVSKEKIKYRSNFGEVDVAPAKNYKVYKVNKVEKWQKLTAGLNPKHMHIFKPWKKICAKLHKDGHEFI